MIRGCAEFGRAPIRGRWIAPSYGEPPERLLPYGNEATSAGSNRVRDQAASALGTICGPGGHHSDHHVQPRHVYDLNADNGALTWHSSATGTADFIASPTVSGSSGHQVIFAGDLAGTEHPYSLATGAQVSTFKAAKSVYSSSAATNGVVFFAWFDGTVDALG